MFDMKSFEAEYYAFIIDLKKKTYGEDYTGYQDDLKKLEKLKIKSRRKPDNTDRIMQLRKDIRLGNVAQVYTGNGRFVWKKIK